MTKPKKEKELEMQAATAINLPPLPQNETKRLVQAEVNSELFTAVEKELARKKLKIRQVLEWGLSTYLLNTNPKAAAELGIFPKDDDN